MKTRSLFLLFIFSFSLLTFGQTQAQEVSSPSLDEALLFLYASDAILADEPYVEEASKPQGFISNPGYVLQAQTEDDVLAGMLNAAKASRNDLDANCKLLINELRNQGKTCEADTIQTYCKTRREEINALIHSLHQERGDKRKPLTKAWHWLKRSSSSIWRFIGPTGRNILRRVGPEALKIVTSGGSLSGNVVKQLIKKAARDVARDRIRTVVLDGVSRMLQGQMEIAKAAGVDLCEQESATLEVTESDLDSLQQYPAVGEILTEEYTVSILEGNAGQFSTPPEFYFANAAEYPSPPGGVVSYAAEEAYPFHQWLSVPNAGEWIQLESTKAVTAIGVQLWGDYEDGWVQVIVDDNPVWQGNTDFENCPKDDKGFYQVNPDVCEGGFFYYVQVINLKEGKHTIRARNAGGGHTTIYFFGLGEAKP